MAAEPRWLTIEEVLAIQARQIAAFGGIAGVKDRGLVESAVANPINLYLYEGEDDLLTLAVRTGLSIIRNHGFNDGNKRTGAVAMIAFLALNGYDLVMADDTSLGRLIEGVIEGDISEAALVEHLDPFVFDRP